MKKSLSFTLAILPLFITSCNVFGGLSSPSNDAQYLDAARSCLDQGDYVCALKNYEALSSGENDVRISEEGLTLLAQGNIFSISDLVASLGTSIGSSSSFSFLAVALQQRGVTGGTARTIIKQVYDSDLKIIDNNHLAGFSKFIASLAMFNEVLANAVGASGQLTASDIVADPVTCKSSSGITLSAITACAAPAGTALTYAPGDTSNFTTLGTSGNGDWSGAATIQKLVISAIEVGNDYGQFSSGSSNQGLLKTLQALTPFQAAIYTGPAEPLIRYTLLTALDL